MRFTIISLLVLGYTCLFAQNKTDGIMNTNPSEIKKDTGNLANTLSRSSFKVYSRSYFMGTINEGNLKDDYALAIGAGISILTPSFHGFQIGAAGYVVYNLFSSPIDQADASTNQPNRYEVGLFDIENPSNKDNLYRLEELYLKYSLRKSSISLGKLLLNTPFINQQDGRMRPTFSEGVWVSIAESKKVGLNAGWIWSASPRSTMKWYSLENTFGIYPSGVNSNGSKSSYYHATQSSGMAIAQVYYKPSSQLVFNLWDNLVDNVMNSVMLEVNHQSNLNDNLNFYQGVIFLHQNAIHHGGNSDQNKTYMERGAQSNVISAQVGVKNKKSNTSVNYTHITGDGRYLMPREWGREAFYTFLPRERNEGYGNVHALLLKTSINAFKNRGKIGLGYGFYRLPDVLNYRLNKYAMPSYHQLNADAAYAFTNYLKGLECKLILVYKLQEGEDYGNLKVIYNKVNMFHLNIIVDYKF